MATKGKKLGSRVTVRYAVESGNQPVYVYMLKSTAEFFGFKYDKVALKTTKKNYKIPVRGSVGAKSIKIPTGKYKTYTTKGKSLKIEIFKRIPIPTSGNLIKTIKFLKSATKNKPEKFISPDGRTWPVQ
jgi:hypothetical protein